MWAMYRSWFLQPYFLFCFFFVHVVLRRCFAPLFHLIHYDYTTQSRQTLHLSYPKIVPRNSDHNSTFLPEKRLAAPSGGFGELNILWDCERRSVIIAVQMFVLMISTMFAAAFTAAIVRNLHPPAHCKISCLWISNTHLSSLISVLHRSAVRAWIAEGLQGWVSKFGTTCGWRL